MSETFVNPYNFVPFGTKIKEEGHKKNKEVVYSGNNLVSGWLDVSVNIKTPLIIPDGAHPYFEEVTRKDGRRDQHKVYSLQKLPDEDGKLRYAIPGSELRGAVRSAYEAVTDSCVPFLLKDGKISQRVPIFGSLRRRGLLSYEGGRWKLYSTITVATEKVGVEYREETDKKGRKQTVYYLKRSDGKEVRETTGSYNSDHGGVMQYNIPVNTKQPYHIAYLTKKDVVKEWNNDEPYEFLLSVLDGDGVDRNLKSRNRNKKPAFDLKKALEAEKNGQNHENGVPVYYFYVEFDNTDSSGKTYTERLVYISNSAIGRIAQRRKWREIIGEHVPCDGKGNLCPACLLFGTKEGEGLKGRVRFSDAFPTSEVKTEKHTLAILGKPRASAFEFYLNKPDDATYWNFDFYGTKIVRDNKSYTEYHHLEKALPKGRKMYWHAPIAKDAFPNNLNSTMEAISDGEFKFKIFFDDITNTQLEDLIWTIAMGENKKDGRYRYKLGHGKPLGYGSCKLTVDGVHKRSLRIEDEEIQISMTEENADNPHLSYGTDNEVVKTFLKMADVESVKNRKVEYPNNGFKIYEWFAENRINDAGLVVLPDPLSSDVSLKNGSKEERWNKTGSKGYNRR